MQASLCPLCNGKKEVSRWFYEEPPEMVTYDRDSSDDIREAEEAAMMVPCQVCSGSGVVWPPTSGPVTINGDVVVTGNVVAEGYRDLHPPAVLGTMDFIEHTGGYESPLSFSDLPFDVTATYVYEAGKPTPTTNPERKRVLDLLATLPEDMPVLVLTPRSRAELKAVYDYAWHGLPRESEAHKGSSALSNRMGEYAKDNPPSDYPPEVGARLAGLPVTEGDES